MLVPTTRLLAAHNTIGKLLATLQYHAVSVIAGASSVRGREREYLSFVAIRERMRIGDWVGPSNYLHHPSPLTEPATAAL